MQLIKTYQNNIYKFVVELLKTIYLLIRVFFIFIIIFPISFYYNLLFECVLMLFIFQLTKYIRNKYGYTNMHFSNLHVCNIITTICFLTILLVISQGYLFGGLLLSVVFALDVTEKKWERVPKNDIGGLYKPKSGLKHENGDIIKKAYEHMYEGIYNNTLDDALYIVENQYKFKFNIFKDLYHNTQDVVAQKYNISIDKVKRDRDFIVSILRYKEDENDLLNKKNRE